MSKSILIVSPALAKANNGNWQTARRWSRFLRPTFDVQISSTWDDAAAPADLLIALHARRSAKSLAAFRLACPGSPAVLILTGTDIYRDVHDSAEAQASLRCADALVVLQEAALAQLPEALRVKGHIIYQSAPTLRTSWPQANRRHHEICMVGHLRDEKDPLTFVRAARSVSQPTVRLVQIGDALDPELGRLAQEEMDTNPGYRWLGPLPHAQARQRLKRCHAMVIASKMEGGANVIIEAVTSGVPVLASYIDGNIGMLGKDYAGYFPVGDAAALARLIDRSITDPDFLALLRRQCAARAPLFAPETERAAVRDLVDNLLRAKAP